MSCATSVCEPRASRLRRWRVTSPEGSVGCTLAALPFGAHRLQPLEAVAAESDELFGAEIGRELLGQLQRVPLPVAHHVLVLVTRAHEVAAIAVEIAEPEMRERERVVQVESPPQRL